MGQPPTHKPDFKRGACRGADTNLFYPDFEDGVGKKNKERECRELCANCDIPMDCLIYACENEEFWGVWGGVSEKLRRKLAKSKEYHVWGAKKCIICNNKFMPTKTNSIVCSSKCRQKNNRIKAIKNKAKAKERVKNG